MLGTELEHLKSQEYISRWGNTDSVSALDKVCKCPGDGHSEGFGAGGVRGGEREEEGERGREDSKWEIHGMSHGNMRKLDNCAAAKRMHLCQRSVPMGRSGRGRQIGFALLSS